LASLLREGARGDGESFDAVHAEGAEVVAAFAPGCEGPDAGPEGECERADGAAFRLRGCVGETRVGELEHGAGKAGGVEVVEQAAMRGGHLEAGSVEGDLVEAGCELGWEHGFDACERGVGGGDRLCAAPGLHETRAEHKCGEFVGCEHEGREIEVAAQRVADAGFAFDGLAVDLEVAYVAVDGSLGDLEPLGECASGLQASGAK